MAGRIGGETVLKNGKVLWGTLFSVLIGVPLYAIIREWIAFIRLLPNAVQAHYRGLSGWFARFVELGLSSPELGFRLAYMTFAADVQQFGAFAFGISIVVATITVWIILEGVTRVFR